MLNIFPKDYSIESEMITVVEKAVLYGTGRTIKKKKLLILRFYRESVYIFSLQTFYYLLSFMPFDLYLVIIIRRKFT